MDLARNQCPVLKGYIVDKGTRFESIRVWCPPCHRWHTHGPPDNPRGEHRSAHCGADSPFMDGGYLIKSFSKRELKALAQAAREGDTHAAKE